VAAARRSGSRTTGGAPTATTWGSPSTRSSTRWSRGSRRSGAGRDETRPAHAAPGLRRVRMAL